MSTYLEGNPHAVLVRVGDDNIQNYRGMSSGDAYRLIFEMFGPLHPDHFMVLPIVETYISKGTMQKGFQDYNAGM